MIKKEILKIGKKFLKIKVCKSNGQSICLLFGNVDRKLRVMNNDLIFYNGLNKCINIFFFP
jgi:hypothetical protein